MRSFRSLPLLWLLPLALVFGCLDESGTNDASDSCESFCEELQECPDFGSEDDCDDICDEVDDLEDEVSSRCEDSIADLLDCASGLSCNALDVENLDGIDEFEEFLDNYLEELFDECAPELQDVAEDCDDELDDDDDDD